MKVTTITLVWLAVAASASPIVSGPIDDQARDKPKVIKDGASSPDGSQYSEDSDEVTLVQSIRRCTRDVYTERVECVAKTTDKAACAQTFPDNWDACANDTVKLTELYDAKAIATCGQKLKDFFNTCIFSGLDQKTCYGNQEPDVQALWCIQQESPKYLDWLKEQSRVPEMTDDEFWEEFQAGRSKSPPTEGAFPTASAQCEKLRFYWKVCQRRDNQTVAACYAERKPIALRCRTFAGVSRRNGGGQLASDCEQEARMNQTSCLQALPSGVPTNESVSRIDGCTDAAYLNFRDCARQLWDDAHS